jgi:hypothetical protein
MSMNLLLRLVEGTRVYHNPNDDLESGAWVMMVCGLEQSVQYSANKREESWLVFSPITWGQFQERSLGLVRTHRRWTTRFMD